MKKFNFIIYLFLISTTLTAQQTYVPDDNFEQALIYLGYDDILDDYVLTSNISGITNLDVSVSPYSADTFDIRDLTGIEDFIALERLDCTHNSLTSLDLSSNAALQFLTCRYNDLTSLNVSSNTYLESLDCSNNNLTNLDLSANNRALIVLDCRDNELTSLDLSYNILLEEVYCGYNELTSINLNYTRFLKKLDCSYNELTSLDLSYSTDLELLKCSNNGITSLDLSGHTALEVVYCGSNELTSLDLSYNTNLEFVDCGSNELSYLGLPTSNKVTFLYCSNNNLTSIDLSSNRVLERFFCSYNELTSLDLSDHTALTDVFCQNNNLNSLNVKNGNNTSIFGLSFRADNNPNLTCIQVDDVVYSNEAWPDIDATAMYSEFCLPFLIIIPDNAFEQALIDLGYDDILDGYVLTSNISSITELNINNKDISDLTGIEDFSALEALYCKNNNLTALDLSLNTVLTRLDCSNNKLETLNLKNGNNINFISLNTTGNPDLACIQIDEIDYCNIHWNTNTYGNRHFCIDDTTTFSENCQSLNVIGQIDNVFHIYPNPVNDVINIELYQGLELKKVNIYNALSQYLYSVKTLKIDVRNLSSGMYFLEVETNKGMSVKKIVVE